MSQNYEDVVTHMLSETSSIQITAKTELQTYCRSVDKVVSVNWRNLMILKDPIH